VAKLNLPGVAAARRTPSLIRARGFTSPRLCAGGAGNGWPGPGHVWSAGDV